MITKYHNEICEICLERIEKVENSNPESWICNGCGSLYSIMKGVSCLVPSSGSLKDWPEMQEAMDDAIYNMFPNLGKEHD